MPFPKRFSLVAAFAASLPGLAIAEPATATAAVLGGLGGFFIQRSQGPSTNVGLASHGYVPYMGQGRDKCHKILSRNESPGTNIDGAGAGGVGSNDASNTSNSDKNSTSTATSPSEQNGKNKKGPNSAVVQKDDAVAVALKHIVLGTDLHVPFQIPDLLSNRIQVAVVANAFEMCGADTCSNGFDFHPSPDQAGRVVYFSNDVKRDQRSLSFGAMPMFGPFAYQGNPVGFSLHVVKLANDQSANLSPLLTTLADYGKQSGAALTPEVGALLNSIGTNLLKGFDVRLLRYDTLLYSAQLSDDRSLGIPKFRYGDYIVVRKEDRDQEFDFSRYCYEPKTGKLFNAGCSEGKDPTTCTPGTEATDVTYGVIQVLKAAAPAWAKIQSLKELQDKVARLAADQGPNLTAKSVTEAVRAGNFKADLALVKAVKSIMTGSDDEAKERLLAIVTKWKESKTPVEGKPKTDDYEAGQLSQLQIALNARCNGLDWTGDALNIYGQMATKCPK